MDWATLLSKKRYASRTISSPPIEHPTSTVSVFSEDSERIIYSSAFRRLQGKTQVHPLPHSDYMRTRLTHTVEVASAGRLIAEGCAKTINENMSSRTQEKLDAVAIGSIVYAACLAHDLGNPPFGHIGEHAIQTWFARRRESSQIVNELLDRPDVGGDFLYFDGNAQGFRIITKTSGWRGKGGLQLSYATLGAFSKYPYSSRFAKAEKPKFGFMNDDDEAARQIYKELGMISSEEGKWCRHPLAYVVEAADDICYLTTDIEDACKARLLMFASAEKLLRDIGEKGKHLARYSEIVDQHDKIAYLRAGAISALIDGAYQSFFANEKSIMSGQFSGNLLEYSDFKDPVDEIRKACREKVYVDLEKMQTEAAGYNIIMSLMDLFGGMIEQFVEVGESRLDMRNAGLYQILPAEHRKRLFKDDSYRSFLTLVDFVSGMTDRYALDLFQKLTGSSARLGRMS